MLLVDAQILLVALIVGSVIGFHHTYEAITEWRMAHPWSFAPSVLAVLLTVRRKNA